MKNNSSELKLLAPMVVIVVVAVCALVGSLWVWADQADTMSRTREENLVKLGLNQMADDHSQLMTPITIWDKAVESTSVKYDPTWVKGNLGDFFQNYLNFESNFLLDGRNTLVFSYRNGDEVSNGVFQGLANDTMPLVSALRTRYADLRKHGQPYNSETNHYGKLMAINGHIYIVGASLLLPDKQDSQLLQYTPFVAVGTHELSSDELIALSQRYMVSNITLLKPGQKRPDGAASVAFNDKNGKVLAELTWMPDTPGRTLFIRTLGPVLMISLGLGLIEIGRAHV